MATKRTEPLVSINLETVTKQVAASVVRSSINSFSRQHIKTFLDKHFKTQVTKFAKQWLKDNKTKINAEIKKAIEKKLKDQQAATIDKLVGSVKIASYSHYRW